MANGSSLRVEMRGDREVIRALERLPRAATREMKDGAERLARDLANAVRAAGRAESLPASRAARTVRTARGASPTIIAGPEKRLFGSEFGMTRRSGWYRKGRYHNSLGRQFKPHLGSGSYWFFKTQDRERPRILAAHRAMADAVVRSWSA